MRVAVIGGGAFGGWSALALLRRGARVTLIDAWAPGHPRSSSGGETRVIRATYGSHEIYTCMAARALALWRTHEERYRQALLRVTGGLWMFTRDDPFIAASAAALQTHGLPLDELPVAQARRQYPQIDFAGIERVLFEPQAGYLFARRACAHVAEVFASEGGTYLHAEIVAPRLDDGRLESIACADGTRLEADAFVFACGPWTPALFPGAIGGRIEATRQEVYYFGTPAGDARFTPERLPVWLEFGERLIYGIPGAIDAGFKVADDTPGSPIDPTTGDRIPRAEGIASVREFLARRFPALARAPLIRAEVCQYESTPDSNFIIDWHPHAPNVVLAGGGSGHGFKMGPVVGEMVAALVLGNAPPDPAFAVERFAAPPAGGWRRKWS